MDFDHHQNEFTEKHESGIPLSSSGLIWRHFGRQLVNSDEAFEKIKRKLIEFLDAVDNGIEYSNGDVPVYTIGTAVGSFGSSWKGSEDPKEQFMKAVDFVSVILDNEIRHANDYNEGVKIVKEAISKNELESYIILDRMGLPLDQISREKNLLYAIFQRPDGNWNSMALRARKDTFESKKDFPSSWAGLRDEELEKISGVSGATFCHKNLFIAVNKTREGIVKMTEMAIEA